MKLASISMKTFVFPLRAVQTKLSRNKRRKKKKTDKIIFRRFFRSQQNVEVSGSVFLLPFVLIEQIFVSD